MNRSKPVLTKNKVLKYLNLLKKKGYSDNTIKRKVAALLKFTNYAYESKLIHHNQFQEIKNILLGKKPNFTLNLPRPKIAGFKALIPKLKLANLLGLFLLMAFAVGSGIGIYNQFFRDARINLAAQPGPVRAGRIINFQGFLTDSNNTPIVSPINMRFKLYNADSGGDVLYDTGSCSVSPDNDGIVNVLIGTNSPAGGACWDGGEIPAEVFSMNPNVYLGVTVGTDPEMTDRQQIANVGYAINAELLQGYPLGTSSASVPFINGDGDLLIAATTPSVSSINTSANFRLSSANAITIASAGSGDILLQASESGTINLRTGGITDTNSRLYITNSGNVGIGTTTPSSKLDVNGTVTMSGLKLTTGPSAGYVLTSDGDGVGTWTDVSSTAGPWTLASNNLYPDSTNYNVGIGATNPGTAKLYVNGNVGIGTTAPGGKLDIYDGTFGTALKVSQGAGDYLQYQSRYFSLNALNSHNNAFSFTMNSSGTDFSIQLGSYSSYDLTTRLVSSNGYSFKVGNITESSATTAMYLSSDANVGIGTTAPAYKLDVSGDVYSSANLRAATDLYIAGIALSANSSTTSGASKVGLYDDTMTYITADTNVQNAIKELDSAIGTLSGGSVTGSGTTNYVAKWSSASGLTDSSIYDNGNVGIGTTTPGAYKLNVVGNTYLDGTLTTTGAITAPTSTNTINNLIINSGALSGVTGYTQTSGALAFSGGGNFSVDSAAFDVTTGGAVSGVTTLSMNNQLTNSYANTAAINLTGNASGITFGGTGVNQIITGGTNALALMPGGNVGIGTTTPSSKLDVNGTVTTTGFKLTTSPSNGFVLTSDASGVGTWTDVSSTAGPWTLSGSNLYPDSTSYNVGVGNTAPLALFSVGTNSPFMVDSGGNITLDDNTSSSPRIRLYNENNRYADVDYTNADLLQWGINAGSSRYWGFSGTRISGNGANGDTNAISFYLEDNSGASNNENARLEITLDDATAGSEDASLSFYTSKDAVLSKQMLINPDGNVGIGTTAPGAKLDVDGNILVQGGGSIDTRAAGTLTIGGTTQTGLILGRSGQSTKIANLTTNGVVYTSSGDGTLNSETALDETRGGTGQTTITQGDLLYGSAANTLGKLGIGTSGYALMSNGTIPSWVDASSLGTNYWTLSGSNLYPNQTTYNVGVGTTTPGSLLSVAGGLSVGSTYAAVVAPINGAIFEGSVGIGTTNPNFLLDIKGDSGGRFINTSLNSGIYIDPVNNRIGTNFIANNLTLGGANNLIFETYDSGWTPRMYISNTGNVGIGTTAPGYKLHVNGNVGIESTIYAPNIGAGTDDSVVVLNSSGNLVTDEIDSRVWGTTLVDGTGTTNYNAYWSDGNTLAAEQYVATSRGGLGANVTAAGAGEILYSTATTTYGHLAAGTSGMALISGGAGAPSWGTLGLTYGGTNANLSGVDTGGLIYKGASALAGTGALTGVLKGNGSSAPSAMTSTANYVTYWSDANTLTGEAALDETRGGTGQTTITQGDLLYGSAANTLSKLGIGTSGYALMSNGTIPAWVDASSLGTNYWTLSGSNLYPNETTYNVGIGMTAPTGRLIVRGAGTTTGITIQTQNSSGTALVTMLDNGNVGIGTTAPIKPLEIASSSNTPLLIKKTSSTGMSFSAYWPTLAMNMQHDGSTWRAIGSGYTGSWNQNPTTGDMIFSISGSSATTDQDMGAFTSEHKLTIKQSGNVGIGTTAPGYKLHVNGNVGIESTIYAPNIGAGTDDSVVVLNSSGNLVTDEIDNRVWGTTLVDGTGTTNYNAYWSDSNTLAAEQYVATSRGGLGANVTAAGAGELLYSTATTTYGHLAAGTSGMALISGGAGAPSWGTLGLTYGGTNANLSGVDTGGLIYKGASALAGTGALSGIIQGNGASAPTAITGTANYIPKWSASAPYLTATSTIYDNGNVGIGTTVPTGKLEVVGTVYGQSVFSFGDSTPDGNAYNTIGTGDKAAAGVNDENDLYVTDYIEAGTGLCIGSDCKTSWASVGGYWTRTAGNLYPTTVNDTISATSSAATVATFTQTDSAKLALRAGGNTDASTLNILGNGNVGIGTTAPTGKLTIKGAGTTTGINLQTQNSSGTALITALDNANVGIGITAPTAGLEILKTTTQLKLSYDSSNYSTFAINNAGNLTILPSGKDILVTGDGTRPRSIIVPGSEGITVNSVSNGSQFFTGETSGYAAIVGASGEAASSQPITVPTLGLYGKVGMVGIAQAGGGGRTAVGTYSYAIANLDAPGDASKGIYALTNGIGSSVDGKAYGVHTKVDLSGTTAVTGFGYGLYSEVTGVANNTTYAGYFTASGGTTNYGVYSAAGTNYFNANTGIGTTAPGYKLEVSGTSYFSGASVFNSTIGAANIGADTDNSVVILNGSGLLKTDEIDSRVWDPSSLVDGTGTTNYNAYWSDSNTLAAEQYVATSRGGLGANVTAAGAGELLYSTATTTYGHLAAGTSGMALISGGAGAPSWGTLGLTYGGTNANLSGVDTGGLIYKGASALAGTGALTGVLKGNGSSAPSAMTSTANYVTYWSDNNTISGEANLSVSRGGTGAGTFTKGILVSPGTTSAFTTVAGTDNYLLKWSSSYPTTTSTIWDDGNVGIGTTVPGAYKLNVNGNVYLPENTYLGTTSTYFDTNGALVMGTQNITSVGTNITASGALTVGTGSNNNLTLTAGTGTVTLTGTNIVLGAQADATNEAVRADRSLTFTQDTNVTITNSGSAQDLTANRSWTLGWTGQLSIARGGTNSTATPTAGGVAYGTGTAYAFNSAGTSGYLLTSGGSGAPTWTDPSSLSASSKWNAIQSPDGAQSLTMGTHLTTWTWATGTGTNDLFNITTDASANGTGSLVNIYTATGATVNPLRVRAVGTEAVFVNNVGNVGIGTTSPGNYKLNVNGNTNITGSLNVTSTGTFGSTLTASNGLTLTTGAFNLTGTSGTISLSGMSASSINLGANNITFTSGNFTTTSTGINSTAIGASTASTGAFTTLSASSTVNFSGLTASRIVATDASKNLVSTITLSDLVASISDVTGSTGTTNLVLSASPTFTGDVTMPGTGIWNSVGNVGIGTVTPGAYKLYVNGTSYFSGASVFNSTIGAANIGTDTDDTVVILNGSGLLKTDEIDSRVWGNTLVDNNSTTPSQYQVAYWNDSNSLIGSANFTFNGTYVGANEIRALSASGLSLIDDSGTNTNGIFIQDGGNVGIGTTAPAYKLSVNGAIAATSFKDYAQPSYHVTPGSAISAALIGNVGIGTTAPAANLHIYNDDLDPMILAVNNALTAQFVVTSTGNMGIGTTAPANKLSVIGGVSIGSNSYNVTAPTNGLIVEGNVGIGTSNPAFPLTVRTGGNSNGFAHTDGTITLASYLGPTYGKIGTTSNHALRLGVNNTVEIMTLTTSGLTGIFDNTPDAVFEITGTGTADDELFMVSTTADTDGDIMTVKRNGNIGIGTTVPGSYKLNVNGNTYINGALTMAGAVSGVTSLSMSGQLANSYANSAAINLTGNASGITFGGTGANQIITGGSNHLALMPGGNVGIGTTVPSNKLTINGNLSVGSTYVAYAAPANGLIVEGNVGIGTISPETKLHIKDNTGGQVGEFKFSADVTSGYKAHFTLDNTGMKIGQSSQYRDLQIQTNSTTRMTIGGTGNIGIGSTAPTDLLEIKTSGAWQGLAMHNASGKGIAFLTSGTGDAVGLLQLFPGADSPKVEIRSSGDSYFNGGKIGIGTTAPSTLLDLGLAGTTAGVVRFAGSTSGNVTMQTAAAAGTWTLTLPTGVGNNGQQLTTNGAGVTSWTNAGSTRDIKNILGMASVDEALIKLLNAPVYNFNYLPGKGTGDSETLYTGIMADEAPWAMHYNGTIVNPVNTLGYMILGIQGLNNKIGKLTNHISFNSTGELMIEGNNQAYQIRNSNNDSLITQMGTFAELVVAKVRSGLITTKELVVETAATVQGNLSVMGNTTVNGTLTAQKLTSPTITNIETNLQTLTTKVNNLQSQMEEVITQDIDTGKYYMSVDALTTVNLTATDMANIANVKIEQNQISTNLAELNLNALEKVNFFNGRVLVNKDGSIIAKGEIVSEKGFRVINEAQKTVAHINASGSAYFADGVTFDRNIATSSAVIAASQTFAEIGENTNSIITNGEVSGQAVLPSGQKELLIRNNKVKENSLIYISPEGSTNGQVLYLDNKKENEWFKVKIDATASADIKFNWWIL